MTTATAATERPQDRVVTRKLKRRRDWSKWGLGAYFGVFLVFLYAPMILMAILSFQGYYGGVTFPFRGPVGLNWWRSIFETQVGGVFTHAADIKAAGQRSLWISLAAGAVVAFFSFTLSMAFRRRFRGDLGVGDPLRLPRHARRLEPLRRAHRGGGARPRRQPGANVP